MGVSLCPHLKQGDDTEQLGREGQHGWDSILAVTGVADFRTGTERVLHRQCVELSPGNKEVRAGGLRETREAALGFRVQGAQAWDRCLLLPGLYPLFPQQRT